MCARRHRRSASVRSRPHDLLPPSCLPFRDGEDVSRAFTEREMTQGVIRDWSATKAAKQLREEKDGESVSLLPALFPPFTPLTLSCSAE